MKRFKKPVGWPQKCTAVRLKAWLFFLVPEKLPFLELSFSVGIKKEPRINTISSLSTMFFFTGYTFRFF